MSKAITDFCCKHDVHTVHKGWWHEQIEQQKITLICGLIEEKNLSPNHWCHYLGETTCIKTLPFTELYEVVFGMS